MTRETIIARTRVGTVTHEAVVPAAARRAIKAAAKAHLFPVK